MLNPIINTARGKMRVLGYCSGSGNTLWKAYELQQEMEKTFEGCPFEIVGIFADNPDSKAVATAKQLGLPYETIDLRKFYAERNAPLKDRELRAEYDTKAMALVEKYNADVILLAGYVWATTDIVLDQYLVINVHPADLAVLNDDGSRKLAGANGIKAAFDENMDYLRSSSHIATKELDAGPLLVRSPKIPVDYSMHDNYDSRFRHYLKLVNAESRLVGARTILELASGHFTVDEENRLHYKDELMQQGLTIKDWNENKPNYLRQTSKLLHPQSVAVIGASDRPGIGNAVVKNLIDMKYKGKLYVVNRKGEDVMGIKGYTSISDIPDSVDLGIISIPSGGVLQVAQECGEKGVPALVCVSAGFREIGGEGIAKEKALLDIVDKYNMRMIGPNCMGVANTTPDLRLSATILSDSPRPGHVAFLTQSGALGASLIDFSDELDVGFSVIVSLGNMANINPADLLPLLQEDENTHIICMYMESLPEPHRFEQVMQKITKPVIIVKSGRSSAGAAAASSHTGSLASNDLVVDALLKKCNVIRTDSLEDAFLLASSMSKMPRLKGNRVGIISNAGGLGTLTADALVEHEFELPQLSSDEQAELGKELLPEASTNNPLDLVAPAPPSHYTLAAKAMIDSDKYDALIIDCVPPATVDTGAVGEALQESLANESIPVFSCFFGPTLGAPGRKSMRNAGIPTFNFPDQMVRTMHYMVEPMVETEEVMSDPIAKSTQVIVKNLLDNTPKSTYLTAEDSFKILSAYGIPMAQNSYIEGDQTSVALKISYPVVAKVDHPAIIHKSDVGGVRMNIQTEEELKLLQAEWNEKFPGLRGIQVQEQISGSLEMIIGTFKDPSTGHAILTGLGGTLVEVLKDISFGHVPLSPKDPSRMLNELKAKVLLDGYRGSQPVDTEQFKKLLMQVNQLLLDFPEIEEMDINPLIFDSKRKSFYAVDARIKRS